MSEVADRPGAGTAAQLILELLPEPVILVRGAEGEPAEIAYGNQAAREVKLKTRDRGFKHEIPEREIRPPAFSRLARNGVCGNGNIHR